MTNPINLQIKRADHTFDVIEAAPVLIEEGHELKATGSFQLYLGFPEFHSNLPDADEKRERYMESLQLMGEDNPGYLGELHFKGLGYFEWRYDGDCLQESEVLQIVDAIQEFAAGRIPVNIDGIVLPKPEQIEEVPLNFRYGKNGITYQIRLEAMQRHFIMLINGEPVARIEQLADDWEVTGGDIDDPDLKAEVLRRIRANC